MSGWEAGFVWVREELRSIVVGILVRLVGGVGRVVWCVRQFKEMKE